MKVLRFFYIFLLLSVVSSTPLFAQSDSFSLEHNAEYKALKVEIEALQHKVDSVEVAINSIKKLAETDQSNRAEYVSQVLSLENTLFDLRSKLGVATSRRNTIEQEYIINNLNNSGANAMFGTNNDAATSSVNLLSNKFFVDNLTESEMKQFMTQRDNDNVFFAERDTMNEQVALLARLQGELAITQSKEMADSLYALVEGALVKVDNSEARLREGWNDMFDTKVYVYTRLLDKLNVSISVLTQLNQKLRDIKSASEAADTLQFSPDFYIYPMKRQLILSYEQTLAEKLAYVSSLDSIKLRMGRIANQKFDVGKVIIPEATYVSFTPFIVDAKRAHSVSGNPIGEVTVPSYGSVYTFRLFTLTKPLQTYSALKNVSPVTMHRSESGKYEYYTGLYTTREEAEADLPRLKSLGFSSIIVEWRSNGKVLADGTIVPVDVFDYTYRVDFTESTPELTATLRKEFPTRQLMKIDVTYAIGYFDSYLDAVKAHKIIENSVITALEK